MDDRKEVVKNKSFLYFLPIIYMRLCNEIGFDCNIMQDVFRNGGIYNVYAFTEGEDMFAITFITSSSNGLSDILKSSACYVNSEIIEDKTTIILSIPIECNDAYNKFKCGKYSQINNDDKRTILKFISNYIVNESIIESRMVWDTVNQVLYKSRERADAIRLKYGVSSSEWNYDWELSSIIDIDLETYRYGQN